MRGFRVRVLLPGCTQRLTGAVLAVGAVASIAASGASAATFGTQGVFAGSGVSQRTVDYELRQAQRAGAKVVRVEATWSALQPDGPGAPNASAVTALDRVTAGARRHNMKVVLSIVSTPCWASSAPDKGACSGPAANAFAVTRYQPSEAGTVVPISVFLVKRYARSLAAFQLWNEPDQSNERYFAGPDKVAKYVAMAKALYPALKQAEPGVPVLAGSFVGTDGRWLKALYDAGMKGSYDGMAVQFYSKTLTALRSTRAIQVAHGDRKPLWLTEFGYTSCLRRGAAPVQIDQPCVTRAGQARGLRDVLTALRSRRYVKAAIQYALSDDAPGGYTFGLYDRRGKVKPAFTTVRDVLRGRIRRPVRPTLHLRRSNGTIVASGTASLAEQLTLRVRVGGALRFRATFGTDQRNHWSVKVPKVLGTRGLSVTVSAGYTGSRSAHT